MLEKKIKEFLDQNNVKYILMLHSIAFTAPEIAEASHISGKQFAKVVIITSQNKLTMVLLPANKYLDVEKLSQQIGEPIEIAKESQFKNLFGDCETGAMPPFGKLYGMNVYIDKELTQQSHLIFNAGTHHELMQLAFSDFDKLEHPTIISL